MEENLKKFLFTQTTLSAASRGERRDNKTKKQIKPNNPP
jgi:hypothetical protein